MVQAQNCPVWVSGPDRALGTQGPWVPRAMPDSNRGKNSTSNYIMLQNLLLVLKILHLNLPS